MNKDSPVIGLLFGTLTPTLITVYDAADAIYDIVDNQIQLNIDAILRMKALLVAVYPSYEFLGWYTMGSEVTEWHININRAFTALNPLPILCMLNNNITNTENTSTTTSINQDIPPTMIYETILQKGQNYDLPNSTTQIFIEIPMKLETGQIEKIAIDQVTKIASLSNAKSILEAQNNDISMSLCTFKQKIEFIITTLYDIQHKRIPYNNELVRIAQKILSLLPIHISSEFQQAFDMSMLETFMISYMSTAVKTSKMCNQLTQLQASQVEHNLGSSVGGTGGGGGGPTHLGSQSGAGAGVRGMGGIRGGHRY